MAGISGSKNEGCWSVVLSAFYEDDEDSGDYFYYTGSGGTEGRPNSTTKQTKDMSMSHPPNKSLQLNVSTGNPVRVIRSSAGKSKYRPAAGYRYDGLYRVLRAWTEEGRLGLQVCKFEMERLPGQPPIPLYRDSIMESHKHPPNYRHSRSSPDTNTGALPPPTSRVQPQPEQPVPGPSTSSSPDSDGQMRQEISKVPGRMHPRSGYHDSHGIIVSKDYRTFNTPSQKMKDSDVTEVGNDNMKDKDEVSEREEGPVKRPRLSMEALDKASFLQREEERSRAANVISGPGLSKPALPSWLPMDMTRAYASMSRLGVADRVAANSRVASIPPVQSVPPRPLSTTVPVSRVNVSAHGSHTGSPPIPQSVAGAGRGSSHSAAVATPTVHHGSHPLLTTNTSHQGPTLPASISPSLPPRPDTSEAPMLHASDQPLPPPNTINSLPPRPVVPYHKLPLSSRGGFTQGPNARLSHSGAKIAPGPMSRNGQSSPGATYPSRPSLHLTSLQMSRVDGGSGSDPAVSPTEEAAESARTVLSQLSFKKRRSE